MAADGPPAHLYCHVDDTKGKVFTLFTIGGFPLKGVIHGYPTRDSEQRGRNSGTVPHKNVLVANIPVARFAAMYGPAARCLAYDLLPQSASFELPEQAMSPDRWMGLTPHRFATGDAPVEEAFMGESGIPILYFRYDDVLYVGRQAVSLLGHLDPVLWAEGRPGVRHPGYWRIFKDSKGSCTQVSLVFETHSKVYGGFLEYALGTDWSLEKALVTEGKFVETWRDAVFIFSSISLDDRYDGEYDEARYLRTFLATGDPRSREHLQDYEIFMRVRAIDEQDVSKSHALTAASRVSRLKPATQLTKEVREEANKKYVEHHLSPFQYFQELLI